MRTLRLGHRGFRLGRRARRLAGPPREPENSLGAFEAALAAGCDGFELDLRLSRDGHIVIHHDARLEGLSIANTDLDRLRARAPRLATLEEVLRRFGKRAWMDLEVKSPGLEALLIAQLRRHPAEAGFVISSFQKRILRRLALLGAAPLCLNLRRPLARARPRAWARPPAITWIAPHQQLCTARHVRWLRGEGWRVLVWTVNDPRKMRMLARAGADAIVSDDPALLVATVNGLTNA